MRICLFVLLVFSLFCPSLSLAQQGLSFGQQRFDLEAEALGIRSEAILTPDSLHIRGSDGVVTNYQRDPSFDDRREWIGYRSRSANQVIRWPSNNQGALQIGTISGRSIQYRTSQMRIRPSMQGGGVARKPVLPGPGGGGTPQVGVLAGDLLANLALSKLFDTVLRDGSRRPDASMIRLANLDRRGSPWLLSQSNGTAVGAIQRGNASDADWFATPVGQGYVRLQTYRNGRTFAVSANRSGNLQLLAASQDPRQFWRVRSGRGNNSYLLENLHFSGTCLSRVGSGGIALEPLAYAPSQLWTPYAAPRSALGQPFWRSVSSEIVPNSPLPPAQLDLVNDHKSALIVLLGDVRRGPDVEEIRIEPGTRRTVELERDSGATLVETVEIRSAAGLWDRQEFVTAIPPQNFYDLSVYEEFLQSIAIDATGTSPNPIEDVNYMPKSVGWLQLPGGASLPARGQIELYKRASDAKNPGAVRRFDPERFEHKPENPLEGILNKFESVERKKF